MFKRKKLISWFIPIALATGLGATQLPTSFNLQGYTLRFYECFPNEIGGEAFYQQTLNRQPENLEYYKNVREINALEEWAGPAECDGYLIEIAKPIEATTDSEALSKLNRAEKDPAYRFYKDEQQTYEFKGEKATPIISKSFSDKILAFFTPDAYAAVPVETFEGGSDGNDINGTSGGSGWSANWSCGVHFDFDTAQANDGTVSATAGGDGHICNRTFTAILTDLTEFSIAQRNDGTTARVDSIIWNDDGTRSFRSASVTMTSSGNIDILTDVTFTTACAYSANTWYTITYELKYSNETQRYKVVGGVCSGTYSSSIAMAHSSVTDQTIHGSVMWDLLENDNHNQWWDTIGPSAAAANVPPINDNGDFFQLLKRTVLNEALAK